MRLASLKQAKNLRRKMTTAECRLWKYLRGKRFGDCKFRRQVPIDQYIADFCCFKHRLIIELDGSVHMYKEKQDAFRDIHLLREEFTVLRYKNSQIQTSLQEVLDDITRHLKVPSPSTGEG